MFARDPVKYHGLVHIPTNANICFSQSLHSYPNCSPLTHHRTPFPNPPPPVYALSIRSFSRSPQCLTLQPQSHISL